MLTPPSFFEEVTFGEPPMAINNGETETNSLDVNIAFRAENAFQMQISNAGDFSNSVWEPYQNVAAWTLTPGDGEKTVYARFKTISGVPSKVISDGIVLDTTPPANVDYLSAEGLDQQVYLKWQNPADADFQGVQIVRSQDFYPSDPSQGTVVYDGKGTTFNDAGLVNGTTYYYTAFSYDRNGNYSSGAVIAAVPQKPGGTTIQPPSIPEGPTPPEIEKLNIGDFNFVQKGKRVAVKEGTFKLDDSTPLAVSIPYDDVPEVLKTMMMTLEKGSKTFSFLLRINKDKTAYEATILPPEPGIYPFTITILDYKNQAIKRITGILEIKAGANPQFQVSSFTEQQLKASPWIYVLIALIILIIVNKVILKDRDKQIANNKPQITNK